MEELAIKALWHEYDKKLEQSLQLNYRIIKEMQTQKYEDQIGSFKRNQVAAVVAGVIWIMILVFLVVNTLHNLYFVASVGMIALFNVFAVAAYIRHLVLLDQVDISDSITDSQQKLAVIQVSLNNVGRILVLQAPFYCTFWYNQELVDHAGFTFWAINLSIVTVFVAGSIYLFNTLTHENIHRKWVRGFIEGYGGKKLIKAMEFLKQIEEYKSEVGGRKSEV
ncbi:hypothetical protein [Daejeonella lutea]|uniref:Uncharacterized protein n=1 Tax=Daejeonella lutea TaxID=572036 RepID=A0A1T5B3W7_9SPHI|nr:hypothetical protein [Daejeonella lutea]SKB41573.1 hypothetical protein SAMN05661099_1237 [Daejeonella lutea]